MLLDGFHVVPLSAPCFFALIFFSLAHPDLAWFHPLILLFCQRQCESRTSRVAQAACQSLYHLWPGSGYCLGSVYLSIELLAIGSFVAAHTGLSSLAGSVYVCLCLRVFHPARTHTQTRCPLMERLAQLIADILLVFHDLELLQHFPPTASTIHPS